MMGHDIRLEDLDGDGKIDVVCSGAISFAAVLDTRGGKFQLRNGVTRTLTKPQ